MISDVYYVECKKSCVYIYIYIYTYGYNIIVVSRHDARFVASISPHHISSTIYISCSIIFHHHIFHSSPISTISSTIVPIFFPFIFIFHFPISCFHHLSIHLLIHIHFHLIYHHLSSSSSSLS